MTQVRTIKKYPNRRLYDTAESRYITLSDIRQLVLDGTAFAVIEQKSGADITRTILLQVISEQESCGKPALTARFLQEMIRAADRDAPGVVGVYLEQSLQLFTRQQDDLRTRVAELLTGERNRPVHELAASNWTRWVALQRDVFSLMIDQCGTSTQPCAGKPSDKVPLQVDDGAVDTSHDSGSRAD